MKRFPAARLLRWYAAHHRDLPWRRTRDPYRIWVSEIMLQQTRAQTVIPYYEKFLERFPNTQALAGAPESAVLACWSGLGYYSRARHLHAAAKRLDGAFPRGYQEIRSLPGVGDYTAAAIVSMAFNQPRAALDGNVMRVIARVTGDAADIGSARTRTRFRALAQQWLDARRPGAFNQALMELGATVCLPRHPLCRACPLQTVCEARRQGRTEELPVKLRNPAAEKIEAGLIIAERGGRVLFGQRQGFWELPRPEELPRLRAPQALGGFRHTITNHHYRFTVYQAAVGRAPRGFRWLPKADLPDLPLSTTARKALAVREHATG
jgi:A/G-specific adenine glycosylase